MDMIQEAQRLADHEFFVVPTAGDIYGPACDVKGTLSRKTR